MKNKDLIQALKQINLLSKTSHENGFKNADEFIAFYKSRLKDIEKISAKALRPEIKFDPKKLVKSVEGFAKSLSK